MEQNLATVGGDEVASPEIKIDTSVRVIPGYALVVNNGTLLYDGPMDKTAIICASRPGSLMIMHAITKRKLDSMLERGRKNVK